MRYAVLIKSHNSRVLGTEIVSADSVNAIIERAVEKTSVSSLRNGVTLRLWPLPDIPPVDVKIQYENPAANMRDLGTPVVVADFALAAEGSR